MEVKVNYCLTTKIMSCYYVSKRERFGSTYRPLYNVPQDSNGGVALGRGEYKSPRVRCE